MRFLSFTLDRYKSLTIFIPNLNTSVIYRSANLLRTGMVIGRVGVTRPMADVPDY